MVHAFLRGVAVLVRSTVLSIVPVVSIVLAVSIVLLGGGPASTIASADPAGSNSSDYQLIETYAGDDYHIPILMYRQRHTVLPGNPEVTYVRTVAAFDFVHNGVKMVVVGPSIDFYPSHTKTALFDVYRKDEETGEWQLVDLDGKPLTVNGKPVDWKTSSVPTVSWNMAKDSNPAVVQRIKRGADAEHVVSMFLRNKLNGADATTEEGLVEQIPCETRGQMCRKNLAERVLFPNIKIMKYVVEAPNRTAAKKQGKSKYVTAPEFKADVQDDWDAAGMPTERDQAELTMFRMFVTPDSEPGTGPVTSALAPGSNPGGIDFSSLQLRYLSEAPGGKLQYSFTAPSASRALHDVGAGRTAAVEASDAFFVWLSMPKSSFWVNLNPNEPNRIVDPEIGTTDVGRIMLQADFEMKKVVGSLINPKTALGKKYWGNSKAGSCLDTRQWIVPAPATVYQHDGGISIVNAPLNVKTESEYSKGAGDANTCVHPDARMEKAFRTLILPRVIQAVNHAPEFAELRRIYLSRVAAEWYRNRHGQDGALRSMIDSGDVSAWPALKSWSPRQVFDEYVYSYKHKEFTVRTKETRGNRIYTHIYTYGGVDFSQVPLHEVSVSTVQHDDPGLTSDVQKSLRQRTDDHGTIWLGAVSQPHVQQAATPTTVRQPVFAAVDVVVVVASGLVAFGSVIGLILAITLARGNRRGLLTTGMAVLLVGSLVVGLIGIERGATSAVRNAAAGLPTAAPTNRPPLPTGGPPTSSVPTSSVPTPPHRATPTKPPSKAPKKAPTKVPAKPKPKHEPPRWTRPERGPRPPLSMFAETWHKRDGARMQELAPLTFAFAIPPGYSCFSVPGDTEVICYVHGFGKKDPFVAIYPGTCGCTTGQVRSRVNKIFKSKKAFKPLMPVDPHTRIADTAEGNGNGKAKYEYWMARVYSRPGSHRLDHEIVLYAQAGKKSDDVKIRKIIGDIYDATR